MNPPRHRRSTTAPAPSDLSHSSTVSAFSAKIQDLTPPPSPPIRKYPIIIIVFALHIIILCISLWIPDNKPQATPPYMLELIDPTAAPPPPQTPPSPSPSLPDPPTAEPDLEPSPTPDPSSPPDPAPQSLTPLETTSKPIPPKTPPPPPPSIIKKSTPTPKPPAAAKPVPKKQKIEISKEIVQKPVPSKTQPRSKSSPSKASPEAKTSTTPSSPNKKNSTAPTASRKSSPLQNPTAPTAAKQDFTPYYALIREKMNRVWKQPVQYAHQDPKAVVRIVISTTGKILSATLEESSGIEEFDQSALAAALEAKEIGAARPIGMPESVTITFRLDSSE